MMMVGYSKDVFLRAIEDHLARARDELARMLAHPEFHSEAAITEKRVEIRATEDVLRIIRDKGES